MPDSVEIKNKYRTQKIGKQVFPSKGEKIILTGMMTFPIPVP
jgi:hypothetical protein